MTFLFGRIYCSIICPLGVCQDLATWLRKILAGKKKRKIGLFRYSQPKTKMRTIIFSCFILVVLLSLLNIMALSIGALIEPYSAFGRMITALVAPIYDAGNNYLAAKSAATGEYDIEFVSRSVTGVLFAIATITFLVVGWLAFRGGRTYCNTICPVGTLLGYSSRFSWLKVKINENKCNGCKSCERHCKSHCIDAGKHFIDYTRCVNCFDCINSCRQNAIQYLPGDRVIQNRVENPGKESQSQHVENKNIDNSRRFFLASLGAMTGTVIAKSAGETLEKITDGGLTPLKERQTPARKVRIVPPGAISQAHINAHCVGCQLCIQACPDGLLTASTEFATLMQPVLNYDKDYCKPECTRCSEVCPAGVFKPLNETMKTSWKIGTATIDYDACLSANGTDSCGNCARHCPAGAIEMVEKDNGRLMPVVFENTCIGCGACEVHCPVGTVAYMSANSPAIHVEGIAPQRFI
ncbi:MAG: 4Fe-4S dicluster domain-containing protein [Muribaculaceae bacterium]|nr:4Fe-4S dicluster domain-containing protein [Muribaculaceae bacterium]